MKQEQNTIKKTIWKAKVFLAIENMITEITNSNERGRR